MSFICCWVMNAGKPCLFIYANLFFTRFYLVSTKFYQILLSVTSSGTKFYQIPLPRRQGLCTRGAARPGPRMPTFARRPPGFEALCLYVCYCQGWLHPDKNMN